MYKAVINDRNYSNWTFHDANNFNKVNLDINPFEKKIFNNDIFNIDSGVFTLIHSSIRIINSIPGVLILKGNKTYGRQQINKSNKLGKLYYKCIPDDMRIPSFIIPYEIKNIGFSKIFQNLYVTFSFISWDDKHPIGRLNEVIGPVDKIENFYEYQLYCKSLNSSIQKFTKDTNDALSKCCKKHDDFIDNICMKYESIEDRTDSSWNIFTIDPQKSLDFDDGFSIKEIVNDTKLISIYISNVTVWMDVLNLWDSFSKRISTIYLPDRKRPMLPTILSDCLCSLQENNKRIAFVMDIKVKDGIIIDINYNNTKICVKKNYYYEEYSLLSNEDYNKLFDVTVKLSKKYKYLNVIRNSHDLVSYLMILMNFHCAQKLLNHKNGIFRSTILKKNINIPNTVPEDVTRFIKMWNSSCGQYVNLADINDLSYDSDKSLRHDLMEVDAYIHITSPIRRLVDLLNIIKFQQNFSIIKLSENAYNFYDKWLSDIEYINTTMRSIRKIQCDCNLLDLCINNPNTMEKIYDGYIFDKIIRNDLLFQYIVYLPELKMVSRITSRENLNNYDKCEFKLFLFNNEEKFKKKIRLQLINK